MGSGRDISKIPTDLDSAGQTQFSSKLHQKHNALSKKPKTVTANISV
jgi:hypothetical protein